MKLPNKLVLFFAFLLFSYLSLNQSVRAMVATDDAGAGTWYSESEYDFYNVTFNNPPDEISGERYFVFAYQSIGHSITNTLAGHLRLLAQGPNGPIYVREGGAVEMMAQANGMLYSTMPASSVDYLADLGKSFGIAEPAYAQYGLGFGAFNSLLELWKIFRNIAYVGFALICVAIGFMIMFRKKIDPRTVMTIQDAIPRIVLTLLLVTFSYAIAGFIVDLAEFATRLIANTLVNGKLLGAGTVSPENSIKDLLSSNVFKLVNPLRNIDDIVRSMSATNIGGNLAIEILAKITVGVVFWVAGFFVMFKIFFALLGPYVSIILSVIFAPLQLLLGALPGSNEGLGSWLKGLIANAAVFPVTFTLLAISAILQSGPTLNRCDPSLSLFGGAGGSALWCTSAQELSLLWTPIGIHLGTAVGHIAGFGILFTIPKVADLVKEMLQYKPSPIASAGADEIKGALSRLPFMKSFLG